MKKVILASACILALSVGGALAQTQPAPGASSEGNVGPGATKPGATNGSQNPRTDPVNIDDQIRVRAYERYLERQGRSGSAETDWMEAEREVRSASWSTRHNARTPGSLST